MGEGSVRHACSSRRDAPRCAPGPSLPPPPPELPRHPVHLCAQQHAVDQANLRGWAGSRAGPGGRGAGLGRAHMGCVGGGDGRQQAALCGGLPAAAAGQRVLTQGAPTCRKSAPEPAPSSVPSLPISGESSSSTLSGVAPTACGEGWQGTGKSVCGWQAGAPRRGHSSSRPCPACPAQLLALPPLATPTCVDSTLSVESGCSDSTRAAPSYMPTARKAQRVRPSGTGATSRHATSPPISRFSLSTSMPCAGWGQASRGGRHEGAAGGEAGRQEGGRRAGTPPACTPHTPLHTMHPARTHSLPPQPGPPRPAPAHPPAPAAAAADVCTRPPAG